MKSFVKYLAMGLMGGGMLLSCAPAVTPLRPARTAPATFGATNGNSSLNAANSYTTFFKDPNLRSLIDTALRNNQEINILMQEVNLTAAEVAARRGAYRPFVTARVGAGLDKQGRYTRLGAVEDQNQIEPGKKFPEPLTDFIGSVNATWEVDIWHRLRNSRKSAQLRYLSSIEGRNFAITNLVAEIATTYYELLALDNQLVILRQNIEIQQRALDIVRMQKEAARITELPVRRFESEVLKNQSRLFYVQQSIVAAENRLNFLTGRFPQPIQRQTATFSDLVPDSVAVGTPAQLLQNRPDIRQAELELAAAKLDVQVARAAFYPSLTLSGGVGLNAYRAGLLGSPHSLLYGLGGDLVAPLVNRSAINAAFNAANARQQQNLYRYEQTLVNAYAEVATQLSNVNNLRQSYVLKERQVDALLQSINISTRLFQSARADYMEVLLTQRDALEARFELVEIKRDQLNATVNVYRSLGGGWR